MDFIWCVIVLFLEELFKLRFLKLLVERDFLLYFIFMFGMKFV